LSKREEAVAEKNIDAEFNLHKVLGPGKRLGSFIGFLAVAA